MGIFRHSEEAQFDLNLETQDLRATLLYNTDKPSFGSEIKDLFSEKHTKYKGEIAENKFTLRFKTQLINYSKSLPLIQGTFEQKDKKLKLKISATSTNRSLFILLFGVVLSIIIPWILKDNNSIDKTDGLVISFMVIVTFIPIILIAFFRERHGTKKALNEICSDIKSIEKITPYNNGEHS